MKNIRYTGDYCKDITKEINYFYDSIAERVAQKMHEKLEETYNYIIFQFYEYEPKNYVRHGMKKGESGGKNLYNAIEIEGKSGDVETNFTGYFDGSLELHPEKLMSYQYEDSPEDVLMTYIFNGKRYKYPVSKYDPATGMSAVIWNNSFTVESDGYVGTPKFVLNSIANDSDIQKKFTTEAIDELKSELKFKYIAI